MSFVDGGNASSNFIPNTSTPVYWDVDGISLQTMAFDIETVGGDRLAPPPLRGRDLLIPYAPGEMHVPKQVGSRVISLDMWVVGVNEDGTVPTGTAAAQFDENFRKLRQLLWTPSRRFVLTKRFYIDGELHIASALGQYAGGLAPVMTGRTRGVFSVDIRLADPYFYEAPVTNTLFTGTQDINVLGDDITRAVRVLINGPRLNTRIRNVDLDVQFDYPPALVTNDTVDIDVKNFTAVTDPVSGAAYKSSGSIRHAGDAHWLLLAPGVNTISVSSTSGIGAITLQHQAVWL